MPHKHDDRVQQDKSKRLKLVPSPEDREASRRIVQEVREAPPLLRPFTKADFEAVVKTATRPTRPERDAVRSKETSESRHPDDSTEKSKR